MTIKKNIFAAALLIAAAALSFSCTKEPVAQEPGADLLTFIATTQQFESGTRTQLVAGDIVEWTVGDEITINDVPFYADPMNDDPTRGFFRMKYETTYPVPPYRAYYPSDLAVGNKVTLPAQQTWVENRLTSVPMYAEGNDIQLTFKNICALFELTIIGDGVETVGHTDETGCYWSSSLDNSNSQRACFFYIPYRKESRTYVSVRCLGFNIRPVSE